MENKITIDSIKKCELCSKDFKKPYYLSKNNWLKRRFCSGSCRAVVMNRSRDRGTFSNFNRNGLSPWNKGRKMTEAYRERCRLSHPKTGNSNELKLLRRSRDFIEWRKKVFKRDKYTCRSCFVRGRKLHPHHIASFAKYPDLRFEEDNGLTLCESCHMKFHKTYGWKNFRSEAIILMLPLWNPK